MEWGGGINLGDFMVAAASYGGPIALTRDETKFTKTQQSGKPIIFVFSSSGRKISSFKVMSQLLFDVIRILQGFEIILVIMIFD